MKSKKIKMVFENLNQSGRFIFSESRFLFFTPAIFLILIGIGLILMPGLFLLLLATFFLTIGFLASFLIWKFLQFKSRIEKLSKELNARVIVQGVQLTSPGSIKSASSSDNYREEIITVDAEEPIDSKKIIFH